MGSGHPEHFEQAKVYKIVGGSGTGAAKAKEAGT